MDVHTHTHTHTNTRTHSYTHTHTYTHNIQAVLEQGGMPSGGLNFDCKVRRESTELEDMFIAHIGKLMNNSTPPFAVLSLTTRVFALFYRCYGYICERSA